MKTRFKSFLIIILLFAISNTYSQTVVSVNNNNFVYAGISNPISIAVDGVNSDFIEVTCENAEIRKHDGVNYQITPEIQTKEVQLTIYNTKKETKELVSTYALRVFQVPAPEIILGNKVVSNKTQKIKKNELLTAPHLRLKQSNELILNINYIVTGFSISYQVEGKEIKQTVQGYKIPANIINELRLLPENTEVEFSDIMYSVSNETSHTAKDVKIILK